MKLNSLILYHVKNLLKISNDSNSPNTIRNISKNYLLSKGFDKIGSGCESVVYSKEGFDYVIKIVYDPFTYSGNKKPLDSIHFARTRSFTTNSIIITIQEKVDKVVGFGCVANLRKRYDKFYKFMEKKYDISDVHEENVGLIKGRMVVFDYTTESD